MKNFKHILANILLVLLTGGALAGLVFAFMSIDPADSCPEVEITNVSANPNPSGPFEHANDRYQRAHGHLISYKILEGKRKGEIITGEVNDVVNHQIGQTGRKNYCLL